MRAPISFQSKKVGTRSWSRYVQMCASYLTIQRTTLVRAFEIRFRTLVYEQLETRETLTLTPNPNGKLFESDYWHASCPLYCKLEAHICTYLDHGLVGTVKKVSPQNGGFIRAKLARPRTFCAKANGNI